MTLDLFAVLPVTDFAASAAWYEKLFGAPFTFRAHDTEVVWELAEHRSIAVNQRPETAGRSHVTIFVDDLDAVVDGITSRGIEPALRETYGNGVRKITYHDLDGNEIGYGGAPAP
ncbi:VOC family protein [Jiangella alkaliphila]|uniref:Glyoxalase-like domain-containing protein n=1 Tax=Jiangella alkaliphila TaxID=419479 RepID=A0A1H2JQN4_9ACTN|nr:VOC family protein [Jiangella alkaliphila]SDU58809.1 Glyoxalase-like domain-containing protein [Jiangella alkaliphila]